MINFLSDCVGFTEETAPSDEQPWFCGQDCQGPIDPKETDHVLEYTKALVFIGLFDMVTRANVRDGDGKAMIRMWRLSLPLFWHGNHYKYLIVMHRLISDTHGRLPARLAYETCWNRTVNLKGGAGHNLEKDLVNEFLKRLCW